MADRDGLTNLLESSQHAPMNTHDPRSGECLQCPWPLHALSPEEIADAILRSDWLAEYRRQVIEEVRQVVMATEQRKYRIPEILEVSVLGHAELLREDMLRALAEKGTDHSHVLANLSSSEESGAEKGTWPIGPERDDDGLLALPCGSLFDSWDSWRQDHLPACATCLGNFGPALAEKGTEA